MTVLDNQSSEINFILQTNVTEELAQLPVLSAPKEVSKFINSEEKSEFNMFNGILLKKKHYLKISIPQDKPTKIIRLEDKNGNENKLESGKFFGGCMKQGKYRQVSEDRFSILTPIIGSTIDLIAGVFDGFESNKCSQILSESLIKEISCSITNPFSKDSQNLEINDLKTIFQNKSNLAMEKLGEQEGGSTCIITIISKQKIYLINVGDSFACLINEKESSILNTFHNTYNEKEIQSVQEKGGVLLEVDGTLRVQGELSITRALGNKFRCKEFISSKPDIYSCEIKDEDLYLLLGTDGLLNHMKKDEIYSFVLAHKDWNELEISEGLVNKAFLNGSKDNVTAVLINLRKISRAN